MVISCELERSLLVVAEYSRQLHGLAIAHFHAQVMMKATASGQESHTDDTDAVDQCGSDLFSSVQFG
jgi:hypothetical protein